MKTLLLTTGIFLVFSMTSVGQNYMGMNRSRILANLGEPDAVGNNYIVYNDIDEEGENIYYFDESENCISFQLIRNNSYLKEYQKMLKRDFVQTSDNTYIQKIKNSNFQAEVTQLPTRFKIHIHTPEEDLSTVDNLAIVQD